jgi:hypothetical protein
MSSVSPAYSYARNNPIAITDPTGLFNRKGECANWTAALSEARRRAGCAAGGGPSDSSCRCQKALPCDICPFLIEGNAPDAFFKDWDKRTEIAGHTNVGSPGSVYAAKPSHPEPDSIAIAKRLCDGAENVHGLANLMIHEAGHWCARATGKPISEDDLEKTDSPECGR